MRRNLRGAAHIMRGALLIELMVGLTIGTLVTAAALGTLQILGKTQQTVDDQSQLLQQAQFIFRVLGQQIRTAGSRELEPLADPTSTTGGPVYRYVPRASADDTAAVQGTSDRPNDSLTVNEAAATGTDRGDCLGLEAPASRPLVATFHVDASGVLRCKGSSGQNQPLAFGVAAFQVRYRVVQGEVVRDLDASAVEAAAQWPQVSAVEVCLDLRGNPILLGSGQSYVDCQGNAATDTSHRHLVLRRLFQLRADPST